MLPRHHIILGAIFTLLILAFFPSIGIFKAAIIFLSSFLIDVDHYWIYVINQKDFNLKKAYHWCKNLGLKYLKLPTKKIKKVYVSLCWFHGIEFIILLSILSYFWNILVYVLIGCLIHLFFDHIRYLYWDIMYPNKHLWNHPILPTYKFIKTKNYPHIYNI